MNPFRLLSSAPRAPASARQRIVVLGIGNVRWADAGFGVRAVERFKAGWQCAPHVDAVEAGIEGRTLLPLVESAGRLIVFNAIDFGRAPGTLRVCVNDAALKHLHAHRAPLLAMDFSDALACAQLKGRAPRDVVLIGVQPLELDAWRTGLCAAVEAQLDAAVELACRRLRRWRAAPRPQAPARLAEAHGEPALAGCGTLHYAAGNR